MSMVKIKMPFNESYDVQNNDSNNTQLNDNGVKLWDNEELVMAALKIYGKMPRPQVFNEISRVCNLSNIRKSRYFHEKMMKNNPFEDKIRKLIEEEGEHTYPYFKIFFEEYKTKKQRLSLIQANDGQENIPQRKKMKLENNSVENSVENSNDYENSNENEYNYNNQHTNYYAHTENYNYDNDVDYEDYQYDEYATNNTDYDAHSIDHTNNDAERTYNEQNQYYDNDPEQPFEGTTNQQIAPLLNTNDTYLENLELKLKVLTKEKENMANYFDTFSGVIDNLKNELSAAKQTDGQQVLDAANNNFKIDALKEASLEEMSQNFFELKSHISKLNTSTQKFSKDQAMLRQELKVTKNYANVENVKLQNELNECRAQLSTKDEQIASLKRNLDDSTRKNRTATSKHLSLQSEANQARAKLNELKDTMDRLFSQVHGLS